MKQRIWLALLIPVFGLLDSAWAVTSLKKVEINSNGKGNLVQLQFDKKIARNQIRVEYINDIIQISLTDVSVYPAKIMSFPGKEITKIFAYQYAPRLVRCRLSVKGKAIDYQGKFQFKADGKDLVLSLGAIPEKTNVARGQNTTPALVPPQAEKHVSLETPVQQEMVQEAGQEIGQSRPEQQSVNNGAPSAQEATGPANEEEKILLDHITQSSASATESGEPLGAGKSKPKLGGGKPLPGIGRMLGTLFGILLLLGGILFAVKKYIKKTPGIGKLANLMGGLGVPGVTKGERAPKIEVMANHYLGPKKSISVVKVMGKVLVLGVTQDSISLIAQFADGKASVNQQAYDELDLDDFLKDEPSVKASGAGAQAAGKAVFAEMFSKEVAKPNLRAQIKSKMEGLKPL